ncbi:basic-leucine zipper domain-containing protein [Artemisia annua]|uniref:Basic-leucine zipper domain-containing protein n=1 Tax=Artemisia annua TaxID=35608 RepID=A0A2U1N7Q4_ARTAN|nr:basic-leucine zipper domain-containing protein [Artemisia annua]
MSSKGYIMVDEKKKKRMISNRESAKRSRMKKEQHMKDLNDQIFYFTRKRDEMVTKIEKAAKGYAAVENENMVLRSQKQELEKRLEYANNVCGWYEGDGNELKSPSMGVVQEPWLRSWDQYQPSNTFSIMSSAGILTDF